MNVGVAHKLISGAIFAGAAVVAVRATKARAAQSKKKKKKRKASSDADDSPSGADGSEDPGEGPVDPLKGLDELVRTKWDPTFERRPVPITSGNTVGGSWEDGPWPQYVWELHPLEYTDADGRIWERALLWNTKAGPFERSWGAAPVEESEVHLLGREHPSGQAPVRLTTRACP